MIIKAGETKHIDKVPFFFIIGRPRSGTTLLQTLFEAHPNVVIPPESAVIKECYERFNHVENWDKSKILDLINFLYEVRKFSSWNIDREKLISKLLEYNGLLSFQIIIKIIYKQYRSAFEKEDIQIFGDKNPRYSKYPHELKKIFPKARFVHIVRDYRDHILSMQRVKLLNGNLPLISYVWRKSQQEIFEFVKSYPGSILSLKYEDFVSDPDKYLKEICSFLEIDYDSTILNFHEQKLEMTQSDQLKTNETFHGSLFKPITAGNVNKWKDKMSDRDIKRADFYVAKFAELSGYERQYPKRSISGFFQAFTGYLYIYSYYFLLFLIGRIPIKYRKMFKRKLHKYFPFGHIDNLQ